jgi:hypothetical protein
LPVRHENDVDVADWLTGCPYECVSLKDGSYQPFLPLALVLKKPQPEENAPNDSVRLENGHTNVSEEVESGYFAQVAEAALQVVPQLFKILR